MSNRTCTIDGCAGTLRAKGLCATHYNKARRAEFVQAQMLCSVAECTNGIFTKASGLCQMHWARLQRHGTTDLDAPVTDFKSEAGRCSIDECERVASTRGLCVAHYHRWQRYGDPGDANVKAYGLKGCKVDGCSKKHAAHGLCGNHARKLRLYGDPLASDRNPGPPAGPNHPSFKGDDVSYSAVHWRVNKRNGRARDHACVSCGRGAAEWAYGHCAGVNELICPDRALAYSTDLDDYFPMCSSCHREFDNRNRGVPIHEWLGLAG